MLAAIKSKQKDKYAFSRCVWFYIRDKCIVSFIKCKHFISKFPTHECKAQCYYPLNGDCVTDKHILAVIMFY